MNKLDSLISWLSPAWALRRIRARAALRAAQEPVSLPSRRDHIGWQRLDNPSAPADNIRGANGNWLNRRPREDNKLGW